MFKESLKLFFKNLKFVVIAMAFIYLGGLLFVLFTFRGAIVSINSFTSKTTEILQESGENLSFDLSDLRDTLKGGNLTNIQETMKDAFDSVVDKLGESSQAVADAVGKVAKESVSTFVTYFAFGVILLVIMFFVGSFLCGMQIRKASGVKGGFKNFVTRTLLKAVVIAALLSVVAYFIQRISWIAGLSAVILVLVEVLFALYRAYIVQKGGKGVFKSITFKDVMKYLGVVCLLYIISAAFVAILFAILRDTLLSILIVLPIVVYIDKFFDIYAEVYVVKKNYAAATEEKQSV